MTGAHISEDQRVLENLALRVTTPDPGQIDQRRFEDFCGLGVVTAAKRRHTRAQSRCHFAWRQVAVAGQALQSGDAGKQTVVVAGPGLGKSREEIGKDETGVQEISPGMCTRSCNSRALAMCASASSDR